MINNFDSCFPGLPLGCLMFSMNLGLHCYTSIWLATGCTTEGLLYPPRLPAPRVQAYDRLDVP